MVVFFIGAQQRLMRLHNIPSASLYRKDKWLLLSIGPLELSRAARTLITVMQLNDFILKLWILCREFLTTLEHLLDVILQSFLLWKQLLLFSLQLVDQILLMVDRFSEPTLLLIKQSFIVHYITILIFSAPVSTAEWNPRSLIFSQRLSSRTANPPALQETTARNQCTAMSDRATG